VLRIQHHCSTELWTNSLQWKLCYCNNRSISLPLQDNRASLQYLQP